jgi:hypothetical protein
LLDKNNAKKAVKQIMTTKKDFIKALHHLGEFMSQFSTQGIQQKEGILFNDLFFDGFTHQIKIASENNGWFTKDNILYALENWSELLQNHKLNNWLKNYALPHDNPKTVAIIMAGNIPLVGFHDFLCALISGHKILIKPSSNDRHLLPYLVAYLCKIEPKLKTKISFTTEQLDHFDAVIATGSDNTARYFEYYFKNKPSLIRKNRNSVAVLDGSETQEDLKLLANDIFRYFGLGCRSVSKLFVPKGYDFDVIFEAIYHWHPIINVAKYANNYDYNKAVYLMSEFDMLENGFLMIKEDHNYASPIATLFYEYYESKETLDIKLQADSDQIQCVVSGNVKDKEIYFGQTQNPRLEDYADGIDTVDFLLKI